MKKYTLAERESLYKQLSLPGKITSPVSSFFSFPSIIRVVLVAATILFSLYVFAQEGSAQQQEEYKKTLTDRCAKIVNTLELNDKSKYDRVLNILVNQYMQVNAIHDQNKAAVADLKNQNVSEEQKTDAIKKLGEKKSSQLLQLHGQFIARLNEELTEDKLEKVKDGMTYRVFPLTYSAFLDMIPTLTEEQKTKIYNWLKEARELAMDEGSSEDKHKVFGKYKGRINNYLSAEGYDLKKEQQAWQERIKKNKERAS